MLPIQGESLKFTNIFALFDPPQTGNLMIPVMSFLEINQVTSSSYHSVSTLQSRFQKAFEGSLRYNFHQGHGVSC